MEYLPKDTQGSGPNSNRNEEPFKWALWEHHPGFFTTLKKLVIPARANANAVVFWTFWDEYVVVYIQSSLNM